MTEPLAPCPFCGFEDIRIEEGFMSFWGLCPTDDFTDDEDFADRGCGAAGPVSNTYQDAISGWNRRTVSVQEAGLRDAVQALSDFHNGPVQAKRPDVFEMLMLRLETALRALAGRGE